jgi:adenosylcobinamide-GDP ribazoletransferase
MLDLIGFFTRIPAGKTSIEKAAEYSFLLPVIGAFIGLIVGIVSFLSFKYMYDFLATLLTIVILYLITGLNHLDGLADFADGLYTSETKVRKIDAMKDVKIGIAGVTFVLFAVLFIIYGVFLLKGDIYKIVVAEICAKTAMLSALFFSKPLDSGIGELFIKKLNKAAFPFSIIFSIVISFILLGFLGFSAVIISIFVSLIIVFVAIRGFGGVNGDIIGAINEISRIVCVFTLLLNVG